MSTIAYRATERALLDRLVAASMRQQRVLWTRRLVLTSCLGWAQSGAPWLPDLVAWLASLLLAVCAAMTVLHAALERRCLRRAAAAEGQPRFFVHGRSSLVPDVGSGLWTALGLLAPLSWAVLAAQWRVPLALVHDLASPVLSVFAAAILTDLVQLHS